jgi:cytohesin
MLLDKGASTNSSGRYGETPLHSAFGRGYRKELPLFLIRHGADVSAKDRHGETPLIRACRSDCVPQTDKKLVVVALIASGVMVGQRDDSGDSALAYAAGGGPEEVVALLIDKGADVNQKGRKGRTPLHCAAHSNRAEIVRLLLSRGADPSILDEGNATPLDAAREFTYAGQHEKERQELAAMLQRAISEQK